MAETPKARQGRRGLWIAVASVLVILLAALLHPKRVGSLWQTNPSLFIVQDLTPQAPKA